MAALRMPAGNYSNYLSIGAKFDKSGMDVVWDNERKRYVFMIELSRDVGKISTNYFVAIPKIQQIIKSYRD